MHQVTACSIIYAVVNRICISVVISAVAWTSVIFCESCEVMQVIDLRSDLMQIMNLEIICK